MGKAWPATRGYAGRRGAGQTLARAEVTPTLGSGDLSLLRTITPLLSLYFQVATRGLASLRPPLPHHWQRTISLWRRGPRPAREGRMLRQQEGTPARPLLGCVRGQDGMMISNDEVSNPYNSGLLTHLCNVSDSSPPEQLGFCGHPSMPQGRSQGRGTQAQLKTWWRPAPHMGSQGVITAGNREWLGCAPPAAGAHTIWRVE